MYDCEICGIGPGCLCTVHECSAYYYPASKEQVIDRLYKGLYKNHRDNMKKYLKDTFGVTFIDHSELPGERRITMNDDSISRQAAILAIEEYADRLQMVNWKENPGVPYKAYALNWAINTLRDLPSAERHGRWLSQEYMSEIDSFIYTEYKCSNCGEISKKKSNYCPDCGSKMEGKGVGE